MNDKEKLDIISYNSRIFATNEQKHCTSYRELIRIVKSLTINAHIDIGSDRSNLNDHEIILSCFTKKKELSPKFKNAQKFYQNFRNFVL